MKFPISIFRPKRHGQNCLRHQKGQALVEFALVTPLLLLLVFGIIEFGMLWKSQQVLTDAAREGARSAVIANDDVDTDSVHSIIESALDRGGVSLATSTITLEPADPKASSVTTGTRVTVSIEHTYDFLVFDHLVEWAAGDVTLRTSSIMRKE